jgi:protein-S-isoprenylcysteine O-methyltransferase Ste14
MKKITELIKAIIILPGSVLVLIPAVILYLTRSFHFLCGFDFPMAWIFLAAGLFFFLIGILFSVKTVSLFFAVGDGTPAPWTPPKHFVVTGPYCYVRNPMILSVLSILLSEVVFFGSFPILVWCVIFWLINTIYFILVEEPGLVKRFGDDYLTYKKNVNRWLPRFAPWKPNK